MEETACQLHSQCATNHIHVCDVCNTEWGHSEHSVKCKPCHTCPNCGVLKTWPDKFVSDDEYYKFKWLKFQRWLKENKS